MKESNLMTVLQGYEVEGTRGSKVAPPVTDGLARVELLLRCRVFHARCRYILGLTDQFRPDVHGSGVIWFFV